MRIIQEACDEIEYSDPDMDLDDGPNIDVVVEKIEEEQNDDNIFEEVNSNISFFNDMIVSPKRIEVNKGEKRTAKVILLKDGLSSSKTYYMKVKDKYYKVLKKGTSIELENEPTEYRIIKEAQDNSSSQTQNNYVITATPINSSLLNVSYNSTNNRILIEVKDDSEPNTKIYVKYKDTANNIEINREIDVIIRKRVFTEYEIAYDLKGGQITDGENPTRYNVNTSDFTLKNPVKLGYAFVGWKGTGITGTSNSVTITKGSKGDRKYTAVWSSVNVACIVKHWKEKINVDGSIYNDSNYELAETEELQFEADKYINPNVKTYTGFTAPSTQKVKVNPNGTTEINYYYTRNSYRVTYNYAENGGTSVSKEFINVDYQDKVDLSVIAKKNSWKHIGWNTTKNSHDVIDLNESIIMETTPIELYAIYSKDVTVVVSFDKNNGLEHTYTEKKVFIYNNDTSLTTTVTCPEETTRIGYDFACYGTNRTTILNPNQDKTVVSGYKDPGNNIEITVNDIELDSHKEPIESGYYHIWKRRNDIKYKVRHWKEKINVDDTIHDSEHYTLIDEEDFVGITDTNVTPAVKTYRGFNSPETQTVNVNADGSRIVDYYYKRQSFLVTYNYAENGGTGSTRTSATVDFDDYIDLTPDAIKANWVHDKRWNTNKDAHVGLESIKMDISPITLYAIYSKEVTVVFNKNGGSQDKTVKQTIWNKAEKVTVVTPNPTTFSAWTFRKYTLTSSATSGGVAAGENWELDISVNSTSITVYHTWIKELNIFATFDKNGGNANTTGSATQKLILYNGNKNATVTIKAPNPTSRAHCVFNKYDKNSSATNGSVNVGDNVSLSISVPDNKNQSYTVSSGYYHIWKVQPLTVTYNGNGSTSGSVAAQTVNYGSSVTVKSNSFVRKYYYFEKWNTNPNGTGTSYNANQQISSVTTNITLYAIWKSANYMVSSPEKYTADLKSACDVASNNTTITVIGNNFNDSSKPTIKKTLTLNTNGKIVNRQGTTVIGENGILKIIGNGTIYGTSSFEGTLLQCSKGKLQVSDGNNPIIYHLGTGNAIMVKDSGILKLYGGRIRTNKSTTVYINSSKSNENIDFKNVVIYCGAFGKVAISADTNTGGKMVIFGNSKVGTLSPMSTVPDGDQISTIINNSTQDITVKDNALISANKQGAYPISLNGACTCTVSGNASLQTCAENKSKGRYACIRAKVSGCTMKIDTKGSCYSLSKFGAFKIEHGKTGTITISKGEFSCSVGTGSKNLGLTYPYDSKYLASTKSKTLKIRCLTSHDGTVTEYKHEKLTYGKKGLE